MDSVQEKIAKAREAGYDDAQIAAKLAEIPGYSEKIKQAATNGYAASDVVAHLAGGTSQPIRAQEAAPAAKEDGGWLGDLGNYYSGIGTGLANVGRGLKQRLDEGAAYLEEAVGGQRLNDALGLKSAADIKKEGQAAIDESRIRNAPLLNTKAGAVGNFVGSTIPAVAASLIPGAQGLAGSIATSAALGAAQPTSGNESVAANTALGAAGGALGYGAAKGIARVISPNASVNPQLQMLKNEGVNPTIGQALGGMANRVEQKATSIPIMGDAIVAARSKALREFNNAAINRATAPIGVRIEGSGQEAVEQAGNLLSKAYDAALSKVPQVPLDRQFAAGLQQLNGNVASLTEPMQARFENVLKNILVGRTQNGVLTGDAYKAVDSELGKIGAQYGKSALASEAELAERVFDLKALLKQQMQRSNPQVANELKAIDTGWANLVRVEGAAKSAKNLEGVFSPAQLNMAVQAADDSVRKRAVSRGTALMQDLGTAGQSVLGNTVPDSGTAGRLALGGAGLAAGFASPSIPLGLAAGAAAYTSPVQRGLVGAVSSRPDWAIPLSQRVARSAGMVGNLTGITATAQQQAAIRARVNAERTRLQLQRIGDATSVDEAIKAVSGN